MTLEFVLWKVPQGKDRPTYTLILDTARLRLWDSEELNTSPQFFIARNMP